MTISANNNNWLDFSYLKNGNLTQQLVFKALTELQIFEILVDFHPVLTGTIPIEIDIDTSDLDILCEVSDYQMFTKILIRNFIKFPGFKINVNQKSSFIIARFQYNEFQIEIYGENKPVTKQLAYRHMVIEDSLIKKHGIEFKNEVIRLKKAGLKTEPAFAHLLGLKGDPYMELLKFEKVDNNIYNI